MTFQQAAEAHLDDVYGYLAWFTSDRFAAEELTAETFERALRLWHRFDPKRGSPGTWARPAAGELPPETFERALRLWHRFDPKRGSARTWLCQVARTVALDHFRSERRRQRREEAAALPERFEDRLVEGPSPELEAALLRLSAGEREVIALRVVLDFDARAA